MQHRATFALQDWSADQGPFGRQAGVAIRLDRELSGLRKIKTRGNAARVEVDQRELISFSTLTPACDKLNRRAVGTKADGPDSTAG